MRPFVLATAAALALSACGGNDRTETPSTPDPYADSAMNAVAPPGSAAADSAVAPTSGPGDLTATVGAFEVGITTLAPAAAGANVDAWINTLAGKKDMDAMVGLLRELKAELAAPGLDGTAIGKTLKKLGTETSAASGMATASERPALERLAFLLTQAGDRLDP